MNRKTGECVEHDGHERPEDDFWEAEEAGDGEQFLAVKPWIGQVAEPDNHNPIDPSPVDVDYQLEYVYGYRCADSKQNVHYNANGQAVYMTAALGVILDQKSNTQQFFGGGKVDDTSKHNASDKTRHTNDIMSIKVCDQGQMAVSGQVGSAPVMFAWSATDGSLKQRFKLPKGMRGIQAVSISPDGSHVACVCLDNDHTLFVYEV